MTDPAPQSPTSVDDRAERRKSIGKYVKRLSTVLRRGSTKASPSQASSSTTTTAAPATPAATTTTTTTAAAPTAVPTAASEPVETAPEISPPARGTMAVTTTSAGPSSTPGAYVRSAVQQERARALFAKYGLTLEAHEWITTGPTTNVQRVEKPIRMRVHRNCHRCNTTFGADRVCTKCTHKRCTRCPRYPPKKPKDGPAKEAKGKETDAAAAAAKADGAARKKKKQQQLTIKSRTGGDLVYQQVRQRVRRTCHRCETLFQPATATVCEKCKHQRCTKCPRDPPKPNKYPDGYPGDVPYEASDDEPVGSRRDRTWRKPRQRVRFTCHECSNIFTEGTKACPSCSHERCDQCTRIPPKKTKREFDPELVRRVEEKIRALTTSDPPAGEGAVEPPPGPEA